MDVFDEVLLRDRKSCSGSGLDCFRLIVSRFGFWLGRFCACEVLASRCEGCKDDAEELTEELTEAVEEASLEADRPSVEMLAELDADEESKAD